MNSFESNNNFMKSMQHLFVQSQWLNQLHIIPTLSANYSPLSSSTGSFSSPIKTEVSDQEEPLNLSVKDSVKRENIFPCSRISHQAIPFTSMPLFLPPFFQALISRQLLPISPKLENTILVTNNNPIVPKRRLSCSPMKIKKSRTFKCNQCRNIFSCLSTLSDHTQNEHGGYKCHICETSFTQRSNLQRHALRHVGFKPYKCCVCCKEYYRKDHLIRHISFNHPSVNPKDSIIQRLSSSESLNFIDTQTGTVANVEDGLSSSPQKLCYSCDQSYNGSNDDVLSTGEENVFLSSNYDRQDEVRVDVMN